MQHRRLQSDGRVLMVRIWPLISNSLLTHSLLCRCQYGRLRLYNEVFYTYNSSGTYNGEWLDLYGSYPPRKLMVPRDLTLLFSLEWQSTCVNNEFAWSLPSTLSANLTVPRWATITPTGRITFS
jgi:hypothetical protein